MKSSSKKKDEVNLAKGGVEQPALSKVFKSNSIWEETVVWIIFCTALHYD